MYKVEIEIPVSIICNAFVGAFEGGSNYWVRGVTYQASAKEMAPGKIWWGQEAFYEDSFAFEIRYDDPELDEGNGEGKKQITPGHVSKGLQIMARSFPRHFADLLSDNDDSTTHDILLQCVVLEAVIYG